MRKEFGALGLAALLAGSHAEAKPPKSPDKMEQKIKTAKRSENKKLAPGVEEAILDKFGARLSDDLLPAVFDDVPPKKGKKKETKPVQQEPAEPPDPDMILPPVLD